MDISIIIPVHNRVDLLLQTLDACAAQTYGSFEIILMDDGSDEDVATAVRDWKERGHQHLHLQLHRLGGRGAPYARNRGLEAAQGRWINFLDSDDLPHPHKLENLSRVLKSGGVDAVYGLAQFFDRQPGDRNTLWNAPDSRDVIDRFISDDPVWDTCSVLWKREIIEQLGAWNEGLSCWQDWELHLRALARKLDFRFVPEIVQFIRHHDGPRISDDPAKRRRHVESKYTAIFSVWDELAAHDGLTTARRDALVQMLVVRMVEAYDFRLEVLGERACQQVFDRVDDPELRSRLLAIRKPVRARLGRHSLRAKRFRDACVRQGWHTENIFPEATWGILDAETVLSKEAESE